MLQKDENMEISQYIKNLLKTNSRVILKNFGAFDTKHIPAQIDKETKEMKPPFKIVVFNPDIKEDAGLLVKHIAEQERISLDNAAEQIDEYVKTIKSKLDAGQAVECKDLGNFKKSADGSYEFSFLSDENLLLDSFGLPVVSLTEQDRIIQRPVTVTKETEKKAIETKKPVETKQPVEKEKVRIHDEKKEHVVKQKPVKEKKVKELSTGDKPKKRRGWLVLLIIILVIGAFLTAVYFFKPDYWAKGYSFTTEKFSIVKSTVSGWFNKDKDNFEIINKIEDKDTNQLSEIITETDTSSQETETVENETETVENETEVNTNENVVENNTITPPSKDGRYYIIVGSVETESEAKQEQKRFSGKGINTDIIYVPNMKRYRISAGAFNSAKAAQDYFAELQKKYSKIEGWVWERK